MTPIVKAWGCLAMNERKACKLMADVFGELLDCVPKELITLALSSPASPPFATAKRELVWKETYNVTFIDTAGGACGSEFYMADQTWMNELKTAFLLGIVTLEQPPCLARQFYNVPE